MKHSLPESQKEIVIALYRYFGMNAEQLSILLNYNRRSVYNMISGLRKQGWVRDIGLGFLGHNHRAYTLTFEGARRTSLLSDQRFQPHIWKHRIFGSERTHFTNEFMTQLIVWSSEEDDEGLINWMGPAESAESHALYDGKIGKRKLRLKPGAMGTYVCCGGERIVFHLEVDTESAMIWRMQDQLWDYGEVLFQLWGNERVQHIHVLVMAANAERMRRLINLWRHLVKGVLLGMPLPNVWFMTREEFLKGGPLHGRWTNMKDETVTWYDLPRLPPIRNKNEFQWMGKRNRTSPFSPSAER